MNRKKSRKKNNFVLLEKCQTMASDKGSLTPLVEKICTVSTIGLFLTGV